MSGWEYEADQDLDNMLREIDTYFAIGTSDVKQVLRDVCSFTRDSGLLTLMHLPRDSDIISLAAAYKRLIPINIDTLLYKGTWKKVLAMEKGSAQEAIKVAGFNYGQNRVTIRPSKHLYNLFRDAGKTCWLIESVNRAIRELTFADKKEIWRPLAILVDPEAYTEAGLRLL
jgi:hypothetical protein